MSAVVWFFRALLCRFLYTSPRFDILLRSLPQGRVVFSWDTLVTLGDKIFRLLLLIRDLRPCLGCCRWNSNSAAASTVNLSLWLLFYTLYTVSNKTNGYIHSTENGVQAVSYTHLDVYKRQCLWSKII